MSFYTETTGYIIHQRNFKDSSLIIEFFSKDYGLMQLIAKGIKNNKQLKSQIHYFSLLKIQFFGKSQLKTITSINVISTVEFKDLITKTAALYLNELIHLSLPVNEKTHSVFQCYVEVLSRLDLQKLTPLLRKFEFVILKHNGFELNADQFSESEQWLKVDNINGLEVTNDKSKKICTVNDYQYFLSGSKLNKSLKIRINKLMVNMIDLSVSYKRIYSRELLKELTSK